MKATNIARQVLENLAPPTPEELAAIAAYRGQDVSDGTPYYWQIPTVLLPVVKRVHPDRLLAFTEDTMVVYGTTWEAVMLVTDPQGFD